MKFALRAALFAAFLFLCCPPVLAQKIQSIEWLSAAAKPSGIDALVGTDIQSKEFANTIKVLKATEDYQDLEYRFDSGKLILSAREKTFVRQIIWNFPEDLPGYVRRDLESHLDIAEDDIIPDDMKDRIDRLSTRLKTRGYQDYNLSGVLEGDKQNKKLILEFPTSGRSREYYNAIDFRGVDDPDMLRYLSGKITNLKSLDDPKWTQDGTRYAADKPFLKDDVELEDFRGTLRKTMRAQGYLNFEFEISAETGTLIVTTRNLRRFEFQFDGQVFFWENELRNILMENLSDRNFDIEEAKFLVKDSYLKKGYRDVDVESHLESIRNKYKVFFKINEGPQYFFKDVDFRNVREEYLPLLKEAENEWLEPFKSPFRKTYFDEEGLKSSLGVLVDGIRARGFLDVEVADYSFFLKPGSRNAQLKMSLRLGPRYKYSAFEIKDEDGILDEVAKIKKTPMPGDFYDGNVLQTYLRDMKKIYEDLGYLYSDVDTSSQKILEKNQLLNTVTASIHVRRGPKVFLRNLEIRGNTRTKKKVILREMDSDAMDYGEKISPDGIREFESRLLSTGLFSTVDLKPLGSNVEFRGAQTFIDYDLNLKERSGGSIEFGPGYRTDLGVVGFGEFAYRNIGGWNRGIFTKFQISHKLDHYQFLAQDYSTSFVEPYPFDFRSRLRFDVRYRLFDDIQYSGNTPISGYNLEETSVAAKLEKRFSEHVSAIATLYQYSLPRIFNIITLDNPNTVQKYRLGGNGLELLIDYRDNIFNTLEGWFIDEQFEYFSPYLASNDRVNFITSKTRFNKYFHLGKESVFAVSLGYDHLWGLTDDAIIPENKRLTVGGRSSLRSLPENFLRFDEDGVAEERAFLSRFEYRMPLFSGIGVAAFYEMAEIDVLRDKVNGPRSTGLRNGAGFGLRYKTPVGPLSADWAYNINARADENDYQISLSIGAF